MKNTVVPSVDSHYNSNGLSRMNGYNTAASLKKVLLNGESYFCLEQYDTLRPFFMNIVSDNNLWMFISSNGGLTAGRVHAQKAIFPYYTDDKITDLAHTTGSLTCIHVKQGETSLLWRPFADDVINQPQRQRRLYKHVLGNKICFEETEPETRLVFRYTWCFSARFGLIKKAELWHRGNKPVEVNILDGVQNILPAQVDERLQGIRSNLVDAYKKSEFYEDPDMGIYSLSSLIIDRPEPAESLQAAVAWSYGVKPDYVLLSTRQLPAFIRGEKCDAETDVRAERGAWLLGMENKLIPNQTMSWNVVLDTGLGTAEVSSLRQAIKATSSVGEWVEEDILKGTRHLEQLLSEADGLQQTADELACARHLNNVLFNIMRGGVFTDNYEIQTLDFFRYLRAHHHPLADYFETQILPALSEKTHRDSLLEACKSNPHLYRLATEYLPLYFSRRHGDPSRPWNEFNIHTMAEDGSMVLDYEGNWRDIFQNWEALALSFPAYTEAMIAKFLNATTADGYNPYRIFRNGIDWEKPDPHDPWAHIGYWGDHQIVYLLKLLEVQENHYPGVLKSQLGERLFAFANVPYRIVPFDELITNPNDTIRFDRELDDKITQKVHQIGADGRLLWNNDGELVMATLAEKLLIPLLAKMSNYVHEGGIWLNTQRPEWNDANNALVGNGLSVVTTQYLKRYVDFLKPLFQGAPNMSVSAEVKGWLDEIKAILLHFEPYLQQPFSSANRWQLTVQLGYAAQHYNRQVYSGLSGYTAWLSAQEVEDLMDAFNKFLLPTIRCNQREDHLFHAYNLMHADTVQGEIHIEHMYLMLEGQVAALSSGVLTVNEAVDLLDNLKSSQLFRPDQYSYLLYPDRSLKRFLEKNTISVTAHPELPELLKSCEGLEVFEVSDGNTAHFGKNIYNQYALEDAVNGWEQRTGKTLEPSVRERLFRLYEKVFEHRRFTGRSGAFYGYEGLNSIYWHMVSKLLLAVQEYVFRSYMEQQDARLTGKLVEHYYEIRAGVGLNKQPDVYGAFPTDPYSHTPGHKGAQQPGMTGQVKEDIINRFGELGIHVVQGQLMFSGHLFRASEFIATNGSASYIQFSFCSTTFRYMMAGKEEYIRLHDTSGNIEEIPGLTLSLQASKCIIERNRVIDLVEVHIVPRLA